MLWERYETSHRISKAIGATMWAAASRGRALGMAVPATEACTLAPENSTMTTAAGHCAGTEFANKVSLTRTDQPSRTPAILPISEPTWGGEGMSHTHTPAPYGRAFPIVMWVRVDHVLANHGGREGRTLASSPTLSPRRGGNRLVVAHGRDCTRSKRTGSRVGRSLTD